MTHTKPQSYAEFVRDLRDQCEPGSATWLAYSKILREESQKRAKEDYRVFMGLDKQGAV